MKFEKRIVKNNLVKNIILVSILLLSVVSFAQDKKAKTLLDEVTTKMKSYKNITLNFKYNLSNTKENINQDSKGSVILEGNKYYLNFMGVSKIFDGKKIYTIIPEDEEVTVATPDDNDEKSITPAKMLTFYTTGFKYSWDIQQKVGGKMVQYVKLIPNSAKDKRKEILLGIDTKTKTIYNCIEVAKNGTKTTLTVNSFKTNQPLPKNQFTFVASKYPKYYINKLD
jgi:outer membrane lipoprotein-sorting protein